MLLRSDPPHTVLLSPVHFLLQSLSKPLPWLPYAFPQKHWLENCTPKYLYPAQSVAHEGIVMLELPPLFISGKSRVLTPLMTCQST